MDISEANRIKCHFLTEPFHFNNRTKLKMFLTELFKKHRKTIDAINYIFCTDAYLLSINQDYLNHDSYTDIITFELSEKGQHILSDIYISIDRIRENSKRFQTSFNLELHRVIFHGALHLCGYMDKSGSEKATMKEQEEACLLEYFRFT